MKTRTLQAVVLVATLAALASAQGSTCLQSPPGLPAGNGQNGAMFDIQATATVVIQDFRQSAFTAGTTSTYEVYAVTGGGTFVGNETNASAWTLLGTSGSITHAGPGVAEPLGLTLGFVVPAGTTQGFYVTSNSGATVAYTNGVGTPGTTVVTMDPFISITEGVGKSYPFGTTFMPRNNNMEVCYDPGMGLFANFTATPTSGGAPLTVQFMDATFTSSPAGVLAWAWDFGDGTASSLQNPQHTYTCPGTYDVTLVVQDGINPNSTLVQTGFITVGGPTFTLQTTGGGVGDLTITAIDTSCYPTAATGYTLGTFLGPGPFLGITPDAFTFSLILMPAIPGSVPHYVVTPGTYPNGGPAIFPAGTFSGLAGQSLTGVQILLDGNGDLLFFSNTATVTF